MGRKSLLTNHNHIQKTVLVADLKREASAKAVGAVDLTAIAVAVAEEAPAADTTVINSVLRKTVKSCNCQTGHSYL